MLAVCAITVAGRVRIEVRLGWQEPLNLFVVVVLEQIFKKGPSEATAIMLAIHNSGLGVAGVYGLDVAETKVAQVHGAAEQRGYPLRAGVEKE